MPKNKQTNKTTTTKSVKVHKASYVDHTTRVPYFNAFLGTLISFESDLFSELVDLVHKKRPE